MIGETPDAYFLCQCVEILKQQGQTLDKQATRIAELEKRNREGELELNDAKIQIQAAMSCTTHYSDLFAELEMDAARYQWLRAQHWDTAKLCVVENPKAAVKLGHHCPAMHRLDDLIDSAIQGERHD